MAIGMGRREFISALGGVAAAWPLAARAQQVSGMRLVGVLLVYNESDQDVQGWLATFRKTLAKLGWTEGQNIKFDYRWVGNDATRMQQRAKELIGLQPDMILSPSSPTTGILLQQTRTIPIVFVNIVDPVGQGFVASLSRPGGNATGLVNLEPSMAGKWIELLKQVVPGLTRVAIPLNPVSAPYADLYLNYFNLTAPSLGVALIPGAVADMAAFDAFVAAQAREPNTGVIPMPSAFSTEHAGEIAALMTRYRLPAIYPVRTFADAGGLMSYGNNVDDNYRGAAIFVDKILKGEKAANLPVQFPTKFNLVINLKTAKALGITVSNSIQLLADEVLE
jgi:putative ABC transport system substrate-binding protein